MYLKERAADAALSFLYSAPMLTDRVDKAPARLRAEVLATVSPEQSPIAPDERIGKYKSRVAAARTFFIYFAGLPDRDVFKVESFHYFYVLLEYIEHPHTITEPPDPVFQIQYLSEALEPVSNQRT